MNREETIHRLIGLGVPNDKAKTFNLQGADLQDANLRGAHLRGAHLRGAYLQGADLQDANLQGADLQDAHLQGAHLRGAYLRGAHLQGVKHDLVFSIAAYIDEFKVNHKAGKLTLYKYLQLNNLSPYRNALYEVGKTYSMPRSDCDENIYNECGAGFNVATWEWCIKELGTHGPDHKLIEVSVSFQDIIAIPITTDGKIRVRKMKMVREVPWE